MGATPEGFHIEFEHPYISGALSERLWDWVELSPISCNGEKQEMPGAW